HRIGTRLPGQAHVAQSAYFTADLVALLGALVAADQVADATTDRLSGELCRAGVLEVFVALGHALDITRQLTSLGHPIRAAVLVVNINFAVLGGAVPPVILVALVL